MTIVDEIIPSDMALASDFVSGVFEKLLFLSLDDATVFNLKLCLHEAVVNAIKHGNKLNNALRVHIIINNETNKLIMEVTDQGAGFDHNALPDPTDEKNIMKYSGRGVYLIKNIMDDVKFINNGQTIKMVKVLKKEEG
ncbi:MAG: ATP-binding protein [Candidatus Omnitrophica bacterium]|nr:ATP-binding protein [Candidatus Omnitrophota bacterium]